MDDSELIVRRRICFPFVGDSIGGSQISTIALISALNVSRYEPLVVVHEPGPLAGYLEKRNIVFEDLPLKAYAGSGFNRVAQVAHLFMATPVLWRFLRQHKVSHVHTQDGRMSQTWGLSARLAGARFIWHQRVKYTPSRLTRHTMRLADQIVCNSNFVRTALPLHLQADAQVVDNPFDTVRIESARAPQSGMPKKSTNCTTILFVGNLAKQKRPEIFLRAADLIHAGLDRPVQFLICGRDRDQLQPGLMALIKELGIADIVHFMGFCDPIAPWFAASDLLLAPEVDEAFGRTLVEAMLTGTPVVASNSGGHKEIIDPGRTGLLVPPDDAPAMAAAAISILGDDVRRERMSRVAKEEALARYNIQSHSAVMMDIYDKLSPINHQNRSIASRPEGRP